MKLIIGRVFFVENVLFLFKGGEKESDNKYIELIGIGDFRLFCVNSN